MAAKALPSISDLRKILDYDPETGVLTWRERPRDMFARNADWLRWNPIFAGKPAGGANCKGYWLIKIFGRKHLAHRVAWAIHFGAWPNGDLDHIDGIRTNNRLSNLREVTHAENMRNQRRRTDNASGVTGVCWCGRDRKWLATIGDGGRQRCLGYFTDFDDAVAARKAAEVWHGFHQNHGRTLQ